MKKKKIILSYDYELFFGERSGTILKTIIEPTNMLMDVMERNGMRGNFFVDYLMFRELEKQTESRAQTDLAMLKEQIRDIVQRGHRIELHLHPHWIDAKYNGDGTWNFDNFAHYSLSSLDEETIVDMFVSGTTYLTALVQEVDPTYRIVAFRAGGWAVQPFDKLKKAFIQSGIIIDSSTSYGISQFLDNSYYDFRLLPNKSFFRFEDDVCMEVENGSFIEVPITSFHRNLFFVLIDRFYRKIFKYFTPITDGTHYRGGNENKFTNKNFGEKLSNSYKLMFTFSSQSPLTICAALYFHHHQDFYCYIDHPKDFSKATKKGIQIIKNGCVSLLYKDLI